MLFREIALASRAVSESSARLEKVRLLGALLGTLSPNEVRLAVCYLSGDLPQGKIGVGYATLRSVAADSKMDSPVLSIEDVDRELSLVAACRGAGSAGERVRRLGALMARATREEQEFLLRLLVGELRQGALEGVMFDAVARVARLPAASIRRAAMLHGALPEVAEAAIGQGAAGLERFRLELFRPIQPMLADSAAEAADAFERFEQAAVEFKLDGARVQLHRNGDEVYVYSRSLKDVTAAVPELVRAVRALPAEQLILDGEVIAFRADGKPEAFQNTMRRFGRRKNHATLAETLPLSGFFFDCLHIDGRDLIDEPNAERHAALAEIVPEAFLVPRVVAVTPEQAEAFLQRALAAGHEGVMLKSLAAGYEAGRRGSSWLKLKPAHTLDLVVLAVEWGSGRRRGWLSNLHLGARDPGTNGFVMLGKTFKGMTDEMLRWQTERLLALEISRDSSTVYVRPELVVEVAFDGVQASSQYPGGVALRFARVKRYRADKSATEADTIDRVRAIFVQGHAPDDTALSEH